MIYILYYFVIALVSYLTYWAEFIMRWLIGFCTYTKYGMIYMPKFGNDDEHGVAVSFNDALTYSVLWPFTFLFTLRYFLQTFNGSFYKGTWNSNFWCYRHVIKDTLTNNEKFKEQLQYFRIGIQSEEYRRRDGFKVEKLINYIWK